MKDLIKSARLDNPNYILATAANQREHEKISLDTAGRFEDLGSKSDLNRSAHDQIHLQNELQSRTNDETPLSSRKYNGLDQDSEEHVNTNRTQMTPELPGKAMDEQTKKK